MESHKRSIIKAVTYRMTSSLVTIAVVYAFTKEAMLSLGIGFLDGVIKVFAYYSHERAWNKVNFGRRT